MLKINDIKQEPVASFFSTKVTQQLVDLSVYISTEQTDCRELRLLLNIFIGSESQSGRMVFIITANG
jgi:hypothetical protein